MTQEVSPELGQKLAAAVEKMPAFPKSVQRVLELTRDVNCLPKDLVQVIEKDPVITLKILKVLNSAFYNFPQEVTSIQRAVVYLGLNTVKNLALGIASIGMLPKHNAAGFNMQDYLLHSLVTAGLARQICTRYAKDDTDPGDCYIAGLLHDFGKVVFAQFLAEEFKQALESGEQNKLPSYEAEQAVIGADHTVVGAMLTEKWQLPHAFTESIRGHHSADGALSTLQCSLYAANLLTHRFAAGDDEDAPLLVLPNSIAVRLGAGLDEIAANLGDMDKIVDEARAFAIAGAHE